MDFIDKEITNGWRFNFKHVPKLFYFSDDYEWLRGWVVNFSSLSDEQRWAHCYQFLLIVDEECLASAYEDIRYLYEFHKGTILPIEQEKLVHAITTSWSEMSFAPAVEGAVADFLMRNSKLSLRQSIQVFLALFQIVLDDWQSTEDAIEFVSANLKFKAEI